MRSCFLRCFILNDRYQIIVFCGRFYFYLPFVGLYCYACQSSCHYCVSYCLLVGDLGFNHCAFIFITSAFYVRLYSSLLHSYQYSRLDQDLLLLDHVYLLILHSTCVYTHHFCSLINMLDQQIVYVSQIMYVYYFYILRAFILIISAFLSIYPYVCLLSIPMYLDHRRGSLLV